MSEMRARSVAKAFTWRALASLTTFAIVLAVIGEVEVALAVGGVEVIAKLVVFYLHERAWGKIGWGLGVRADVESV